MTAPLKATLMRHARDPVDLRRLVGDYCDYDARPAWVAAIVDGTLFGQSCRKHALALGVAAATEARTSLQLVRTER